MAGVTALNVAGRLRDDEGLSIGAPGLHQVMISNGASRQIQELQTSNASLNGERLTQNNDTGSSITDLLVLRPRQLNHALCRGMSNVNLSQNGVTVVCQAAASVLALPHSRGDCSSIRFAATFRFRGPYTDLILFTLADIANVRNLQDTAHGVEDHLQHGFGAETCPDDICDGLSCEQTALITTLCKRM
jgi:hypothetical protein